MERRTPAGPGRTAAGLAGLAIVVLWFVVMALALAFADSVRAADLASGGAARQAFEDPPAAVARAEFGVGLVGITALPAAVVVIALGYRGVVRGWVSGHRIGWVALVLGGVGLLPAVAATLFGVLICVLDGGALTGG